MDQGSAPASAPASPSGRPLVPVVDVPLSRTTSRATGTRRLPADETFSRHATSTTSQQDRIEAILEVGRRRADSTAVGRPPAVPMEPLLRSRPVGGAGAAGHGDEAGRQIGYQSIGPAGPAGPRGEPGEPGEPREPGDSAGARRHNSSGTTAAEAADGVGWWTSLLAGVQTLELENKGSVARDHLALERTFLAWLRTSLAFASIGIAVTQLFRLSTTGSDGGSSSSSSTGQLDALRRVGRPLGSTFLGISILMLFLGYHRYHQSQQWLLRGRFPASRGTVLLVSVVALALMVTSLVVVVVQPHG